MGNLQVWGCTGVQVYRCTGVLVYRCTGVQVCGCTCGYLCVQVYGCTCVFMRVQVYTVQSQRSTTLGDSVLRLSENLSMSICAGERDFPATSSRAVYCSWSDLPSRGPACHRARLRSRSRRNLGSSYLTEGRDKGPEVVGTFRVQELGSLMTTACSIFRSL